MSLDDRRDQQSSEDSESVAGQRAAGEEVPRRGRERLVAADRSAQSADLLDSDKVWAVAARGCRCFSSDLHGTSSTFAAITRTAGAAKVADASGASRMLPPETSKPACGEQGCRPEFARAGDAGH